MSGMEERSIPAGDTAGHLHKVRNYREKRYACRRYSAALRMLKSASGMEEK